MIKHPDKILIVDDEPKIAEVLVAFLENKGFETIVAHTGQEALRLFAEEAIALILLDLMLPDISGEEVCKKIREGSKVPIMMLTAKAEEADLIAGLDLGADDYMSKPFSLKTLYARISALLRRAKEYSEPARSANVFDFGDVQIDFDKNSFIKAGKSVSLTPNEFKLLEVMVRQPGRVFSREELITLAFGDDFDGYNRAVDSHIKNLRHKIEDNPKEPIYIVTVHGLGYKFGGK